MLAFYSIISVGLFIRDQIRLENENRLRASLKSTDLSSVIVDNYKLGEKLTSIDERIFLLYCENGKYFSGYSQGEDLSGCVTKRVIGLFGKRGTEIIYNGDKITSIDEAKKKIGNNYLEGIPVGDDIDTFTYIDHENNIELLFTMSGEINLKRVDDNSDRRAAPLIRSFYNPVFMIFLSLGIFKSRYLLNTIDYFSLPLYFSLLTFPIALLFTEKNKKARKWVWIIAIGLLIISVLVFGNLIFNMMMSA